MTLKLGSKGDWVKALQKSLNLVQDGIYGPVTEEAVADFQKNNGLKVDGICGEETWSKLNPPTQTKRKINMLILHCSATPEGKDYTVETIRQWHTKPISQGGRGWSDIGYHYVIYRDGSVHTGRAESTVGAHCAGKNAHSLGICYIGGTDTNGKSKDTRTDTQKKALVTLVKQLMTKYGISKENVYGHYQFANKACPSFKIESFRAEL